MVKINFKKDRISLNHGSGGLAMIQLIEQLFKPAFDNHWLNQGEDQACFEVEKGRLAMSTDAHVVSPLFFPGGDIGSLAVHGTINDLAMSGAIPQYLSASFIIEEGLAMADLKAITLSMAEAAKAANVAIICGDTKVVERGKGDGLFISTTGIGRIPEGIFLSAAQIKPGDKVILNGSIAEHGIAVLSKRQHLDFTTGIESDSASLHELVQLMLTAAPGIKCLRDPTRGGVATSLNEWAQQSGHGFLIDEQQIPVASDVASACELLGLDPLYIANEGKLLAVCPEEDSEQLIQAMRQHPLGKEACMIGQVIEDPRHWVQLRTKLGGKRLMDCLTGEQLPRIC